ncbi:unnamed protein product [Heterotrigona itama]|uniref:Uncharacterized protein n=1 Tax=Heterotrigona itama TaxID=395501 RepID=A0A6V7GUQ6_9HYME|nr:unnamed protein product [Heterotrigona itama]
MFFQAYFKASSMLLHPVAEKSPARFVEIVGKWVNRKCSDQEEIPLRREERHLFTIHLLALSAIDSLKYTLHSKRITRSISSERK